jgi:hypothetical protein
LKTDAALDAEESPDNITDHYRASILYVLALELGDIMLMQKQCNTVGVFEELELVTSRKRESRFTSKAALESRLRRWSNQLGFQFRNAYGGTFKLWRKSLGRTHFETLFEVQAFLENVSLALAHVRDLRKAEDR